MGSLPSVPSFGGDFTSVLVLVPSASWQAQKKERSGIPAGSLQPTQENREVPYPGTALSQHNRHRAYAFLAMQPSCQAVLRRQNSDLSSRARGFNSYVTRCCRKRILTCEKGTQLGHSSTRARPDFFAYGPFNQPDSDITKVNPAPDMEEAQRFAKEKGVKLWVWLYPLLGSPSRCKTSAHPLTRSVFAHHNETPSFPYCEATVEPSLCRLNTSAPATNRFKSEISNLRLEKECRPIIVYSGLLNRLSLTRAGTNRVSVSFPCRKGRTNLVLYHA